MAFVTLEPGLRENSPGVERCESCDLTTPWWWAHGVMPLCPDCAREMTDAEAYEMAKESGHGPLPSPKELKELQRSQASG